MRVCDQCGTKMPFGRRRTRVDGRMLCNGCDPDGKGPGEGRPVGHHGSLEDEIKSWSPEQLMDEIAKARKQVDDALAARGPRSGPAFVDSENGPGPYLSKLLQEKSRRMRERNQSKGAKVASVRDPIRLFAMQFVAHDSGDGETIYHCPFCGGGQVTGRSDGTVECNFCETAFTVQVQPIHSGAPQTIDGQPVEWAGQPPGHFQPEKQDPNALMGDVAGSPPGDAPPAPGAPDGSAPQAPPHEDPHRDGQPSKNPVPPQFRKGVFITATGAALPTEAYMRHLAITMADDPRAVINEVRAEREA